MIERILEPELMEDEEQVLAYSNADFTSSNRLFVNYIVKDTDKNINQVLDLGCGSGDVDIELATRLPNVKMLAIDGSNQMTKFAKQKIKDYSLDNRIEIETGRLPNLDIKTREYDIIISKDLLHHLPNPNVFWYEAERLSKESTTIYLMDLLRPDSIEDAKQIVETVASNEPDVLKMDFYNSLLAAFTIDEIKQQIGNTSFNYHIEKLGDRHFIIKCYKRKK